MKGKPGSEVIIHRHSSLNGASSMMTGSDSVTLDISFSNGLQNGIYKYVFDLHFSSSRSIKVFLYGECGGVGYNATTWYTHWDRTFITDEKQNNTLGGYFHRGHGDIIHISGEFRYFGDHLRNLGVNRTINGAGDFNEFLVQRLEKIPSEPKLLGLHMTWVFENKTAAQAVNLTGDSYFYFERLKSI